MLEKPETKVGTVLGGLIKQQTRKFEDEGPLNGKQMLQKHSRLVGAQCMQKDAKDRGQEALRMVGVRDHLHDEIQGVEDKHAGLGSQIALHMSGHFVIWRLLMLLLMFHTRAVRSGLHAEK